MQYHIQGLRWVRKFSSIIALVLGGCLLYIFVQMEFWSIVGPIAGFTIGALIFTIWMAIQSRQWCDNNQSIEYYRLPVQIPIIVTSLFIILMIGIFRFSLYERPVAQYVLFGGFAGFIGYQIAGGATRRRIVPQVLVLAFLTYWSSQFLFPVGMYAIDTHHGYIPRIEGILATGYYNHVGGYMGHLIYTSLFATITGFSSQTAYFVLATALLTGTALVLSIFNQYLSNISEQVALFAALIFSISSWTIGRGMHPNKLNFFYPLIVLFGITAIILSQSSRLSRTMVRRWFLIGVIITPAVVFGHRFSAGAVLLLLLAIFGYTIIARGFPANGYEIVPQGFLGPFVAIYFLAVIGNPLHQGPLLGRLSDLIVSMVVPAGKSGAASGPGRFSNLALEVLIASTAAQTIIFSLAVIGAIWMFQRRKWEYDLVIFWLICVGILLAVALLQNSADTAPQRFYGLLMLFGFNITIGIVFDAMKRRELSFSFSSIRANPIITVLVIMLAVTSLASPIADRATSPVSDKIPDIRQFSTIPLNEGNEWTQQYAGNASRIVAPNSEVPIERTGPIRGTVNRTAINSGTLIVYSHWSEKRGVVIAGGRGIGGRNYVFVPSPERPFDSRIYQSGSMTIFIVHREPAVKAQR